jgi:hypothetical protein
MEKSSSLKFTGYKMTQIPPSNVSLNETNIELCDHDLEELFDDGERFVQYYCHTCKKEIWFDMYEMSEIPSPGENNGVI